MKSKPDVMKTYDAIAEDFDGTRYKPWPDTIEFAKRFSREDLILDLGCGNGRDLRHFESLGINVAGLDFSIAQLKVVQSRARTTPLIVCGDVCNLPFTDNLADGAILVATLHHLTSESERLTALREVHRCLKPGGLALLGVWAQGQTKFEENLHKAKAELGGDWEPGDMLLDWKMPGGKTFPRYYHLFAGEEFDDLLAMTEFKIEITYFSCDNFYGILRK